MNVLYQFLSYVHEVLTYVPISDRIEHLFSRSSDTQTWLRIFGNSFTYHACFCKNILSNRHLLVFFSWSRQQILQQLHQIFRMLWLCFPTCLPQITKWRLPHWLHLHHYHQGVKHVWGLRPQPQGIHSAPCRPPTFLLNLTLNTNRKTNLNLDSFSLQTLGEAKLHTSP